MNKLNFYDNLLRLKELDPDLYSEIADACEKVDIEFEEDVIQGCLQRAIEKRGWGWQVQTFDDPDPAKNFYIAYVVGDGHENKADKNSPAAALLAAYLEARQ